MQLSARRVPDDLPGSGWYELLPAPPLPRVLEQTIRCDWVIIGAGFAGLTAAQRLVDRCRDEKIVMLDAQRVGWGAAGRNSGFMIDLPHDLQSDDYRSAVEVDSKQVRLNRAAIRYAREIINRHQLHACLGPKGKINAATDQRNLRTLHRYCQHLDRLEEAYQVLDADALQRITGTDYYCGGILTPGCMQIQPARYIRGLADGLSRQVDIYENSPVLHIESGAIHRIRTERGEIRAKHLILTVNGHLGSFGLYDRQLMHVFTYASMTRLLDPCEQEALGGDREWGILPAHPTGSTVRRIREGRIVVRNTFTYNPKMRTSASQVARIGKRHDRSFRHRFPMLDQVEMQYRWGGLLCLSRNSVPVFGEIEKNVFVACCQNGLGTVRGTLGGMLIVDLATGQPNPMVNDLLAEDEPKKLVMEPFMTIGAKGHLWWSQRHASRDY